MQLFEQEIDGLFAMPRLNDNDIYCQKEQYFSIVKKYNDAHVRLIQSKVNGESFEAVLQYWIL